MGNQMLSYIAFGLTVSVEKAENRQVAAGMKGEVEMTCNWKLRCGQNARSLQMVTVARLGLDNAEGATLQALNTINQT